MVLIVTIAIYTSKVAIILMISSWHIGSWYVVTNLAVSLCRYPSSTDKALPSVVVIPVSYKLAKD